MKEILRIRPCKKQDGDFVMKWLTDEKMMRMWCRETFSFPLTKEQMNAHYEKLEQAEDSWGFTALNQEGIAVGSFQMSRVNYQKSSVHLGYIVVDPAQRGKGLGYSMVSKAVRYGVDILGMKRITLNVFDSNPGARRCYEKVGFIQEKMTKHDFSFGDEIWGCSLMVYTEHGKDQTSPETVCP